MKATDNSFAELLSYLNDLRSLIQSSPHDRVIYKEGTTIGQIAFHVTESVSYYLRVYILNEAYERNRDKEFTTTHSREEILSSFNKAIATCRDIVSVGIDMETPLKKVKKVHSRGLTITNVFETIQHVTAYTAEHYGHIVVSA